tara:strand:+ start:225 stop:500 length:276 start_codon:yes stop_codon:yes gene_type:complete
MEIYTATLILQKHLNQQNDKRNLPKVNEEKLKEAINLLTDLLSASVFITVLSNSIDPSELLVDFWMNLPNTNKNKNVAKHYVDKYLAKSLL